MTGKQTDDGWRITHSYDSERDRPSCEVVRAVAAATDRSVMDLEPLYETVETDALDELLGRAQAAAGGHLRVTFSYAGCRVTADADEEIVVVRPENGS